MAKVQSLIGVVKPEDPDTFMKMSQEAHRDVIDQVNGKLQFDSNMATQTITVNFLAANTDTPVSHKLNKVGVHYLVSKANKAVRVFDGATSSTKNTIYLQCDVSAKVTLILH